MSTVKLTCLLDGHAQDFTYSVAFPLDLTVGELFDCVENYHDWSSGCQCEAAPARSAWVTRLKMTPNYTHQSSTLEPSPARRCLRDDLVRSIVDDIAPSETVHLQIETKMRARPQFSSFFRQSQVGPSVALKCGPFDQFRVQSAKQSFVELYSTPGSLFVDKTSFVNPIRLHTTSPHVVIRRPSGFGKSTFLSMMASYFDSEANVGPSCFRAVGALPDELVANDGQQQLLVISLDLGRLDLSEAHDDRLLIARCDAFMDRELCREVERYRRTLHPTWDRAFDKINCAWSFLDRLKELRIDVMIAVDNYTSPFKGLLVDRRAQIERVTYYSIINPLINLIDHDLVWRSYFVGEDLAPDEPLPWSNRLPFHEYFQDLTESAAADAAFGLCAFEVRALWQVAFPQLDNMPDPLGLVDPGATEDDGRRYSIRDVLEVLESLRSCRSDEERVAFQAEARAACITLQPEYTLHPSNSNTPLILARPDLGRPTEWAPHYKPPPITLEEPGSEPWSEHYARLAAPSEAIRRLDEDPTAEIPGILRFKPDPSGHLSVVRDDKDESFYQSPERNKSVELGAFPDVTAVHSPPQLADLRPEVKSDPQHPLPHDDSESDRASIYGSDHREGSNASTAPTSVPASLNTSPRSNGSSKRSRTEEGENERGRDTPEDVSAYGSDSDRSSSGRSMRRRLRIDSTPGSP